MKKIGFVGLGTMGFPMANNLLKAGYEVIIYNRTLEKAEKLGAQGAKVVLTPTEVAKNSDVIFSMLTADRAVEEVVLGENGLVHGLREGQIVIDCSTISPNTSKKIALELAKYGVEVLDAPVTGSEPQAIDGILTFMVGGKKEVFEQSKPLFDVMGKTSYYMGKNGAGSYTKLANNTMAAINLLSMVEAITMATKAGIDPEIFVKVVSGGGARSGMMDNKTPKILNRDFHANFATALMYKDLGLATQLASEIKVPVPVLSLVKEMLQMAIVKGYADEDMCAVIKCYEEWAEVKVASKG